jgi:diguanylate cyclase (GGDEF)-like protein
MEGEGFLAAYIYLELDLFAAALLLLMIGFRKKGDARSAEQKLFNLVLLLTAMTVVFDAAQWYFDGRAGMRGATVAAGYLYYASNTAVPFAWFAYCDYKIIGSASGLRRRMRFATVPAVLLAALLATNAWTHFVFGFDARNHYFRGGLFLLYTVLSYLPALATFFMAIMRYGTARTKAERKELRFFLTFMVFPTIGYLVQLFFYGLPLIWIGTTLALFLIYTNVQNGRIYEDELTGLSNRRRIVREFSRRIDDLDAQERIYAVMIDADDFKIINDRFGHAVGDHLLINAARMLERLCQQNGDFVARMGGDEFLILATRRADEVFLLPEEIREAVSFYRAGANAEVALSFSCGVGEYGKDGAHTLDALLSAADSAMYRNKAEWKKARPR